MTSLRIQILPTINAKCNFKSVFQCINKSLIKNYYIEIYK